MPTFPHQLSSPSESPGNDRISKGPLAPQGLNGIRRRRRRRGPRECGSESEAFHEDQRKLDERRRPSYQRCEEESESASSDGDQRISDERGRFQEKGDYSPESSSASVLDVKITGFRRVKRIKKAGNPLNLSISIRSEAFRISIKYPTEADNHRINGDGLKNHHEQDQHSNGDSQSGEDCCAKAASDGLTVVSTPTGKDYEIPRPLVCPPAPRKRRRNNT